MMVVVVFPLLDCRVHQSKYSQMVWESAWWWVPQEICFLITNGGLRTLTQLCWLWSASFFEPGRRCTAVVGFTAVALEECGSRERESAVPTFLPKTSFHHVPGWRVRREYLPTYECIRQEFVVWRLERGRLFPLAVCIALYNEYLLRRERNFRKKMICKEKCY